MFVLGSPKLPDEALIHFSDIRRSDNSILVSVGDWSSSHIEDEILYRFVVAEAAALPSRGSSCLYHEESDASRVGAAGIEQRPENFFLRGPRVNAGDSLDERTWRRTRRGWCRACSLCGQFRQHPLDEFRLQLGELAFENLRHHARDDLLEILAVRHSQRTVSQTRVFRTYKY